MNTLKKQLKEAAEYYEKHSQTEKTRAEKMTGGCSLQIALLNASTYNKGRARAMRDALELLEEYIG